VTSSGAPIPQQRQRQHQIIVVEAHDDGDNEGIFVAEQDTREPVVIVSEETEELLPHRFDEDETDDGLICRSYCARSA